MHPRMAGKSLDARKGAAARRASDYMVNKIAFAGDAKHNLVGIFSEGTDIPLYTLSEVTIDGKKYTDWAHKTADQILEDINGMQKFVDKITMSYRKARHSGSSCICIYGLGNKTNSGYGNDCPQLRKRACSLSEEFREHGRASGYSNGYQYIRKECCVHVY